MDAPIRAQACPHGLPPTRPHPPPLSQPCLWPSAHYRSGLKRMYTSVVEVLDRLGAEQASAGWAGTGGLTPAVTEPALQAQSTPPPPA